MTQHTDLDSLDKKLLDIIQTRFPLVPRPYADLGTQVGISEQEALDRVNRMREMKLIRRLGANFDSKKLGFRSTLCAAKVAPEQMENFVETVNALPGVTHNYLRKNVYNVWFTYIAPSWDAVCADLATITEKTGVTILNLPATKLFKIRVDFSMNK